MRKTTFTLLLLLPVLASAQPPQGMGEFDQQKIMQQMQKMQACMAEVDMAELEKFEQRAKQMTSRVEALCASGKRDEAQEEGIKFAKEVSANQAMQKMQECGKMMEGMSIPGMPPMPSMPRGDEKPDEQGHICDQ